MILSKRPDIERFLASPPPEARAAVVYGRDRAIVRERANAIAAKATERPDDPFDVAVLNEGDVDDAARASGGGEARKRSMSGRLDRITRSP